MPVLRPYERDWESLARTEPYFAVLTEERYRSAQLADHQAEFWRSGDDFIAELAHLCQTHLGCALAPDRALDFGCGVGRILLPLAQRSRSAVGVDISPTMLSLAQASCQRAGLSNVSFAPSIPPRDAFDLVVSVIVFQHIPVKAGLAILDDLLGVLSPGGLIALHFLFARPGASPGRRWARFLYATYRPVHALVDFFRRRSNGEAYMQMNVYPFNAVLRRLAARGIADIHLSLTDHGGFEGALLIGRRAAAR
jgi:SAM-dependent methyltransferase